MTDLKEDVKKEYVAPKMDVMEMGVQRTLCGSSGDTEIDHEDDY